MAASMHASASCCWPEFSVREAGHEACDESCDHGKEHDGDQYGEEPPGPSAQAAATAPACHSRDCSLWVPVILSLPLTWCFLLDQVGQIWHLAAR